MFELFEGMMKRSDPWISGDRDGPRPTSKPAASIANKKPSPHSQRLENLAKQGRVPVSQVSKLWDEEREKVDGTHPQRWSIVTANVKRRLGLS